MSIRAGRYIVSVGSLTRRKCFVVVEDWVEKVGFVCIIRIANGTINAENVLSRPGIVGSILQDDHN